jgi:hypothetical protein
MNNHPTGCAALGENFPALNLVEIAFQHLCEKHRDILESERETYTEGQKHFPDVPVSVNEHTRKSIFMLRNWFDVIEKFECNREYVYGRYRAQCPSGKRHLDADDDDGAPSNGETLISNIKHEDVTPKRSKSGTFPAGKYQTSFDIASGLLVFWDGFNFCFCFCECTNNSS